MTSVTAQMQELSLDEASASTPATPKPPAEAQTRKSPKITETRASRPDQVDTRPVPSTDEWLEVQAAGGCMYYGFYADNDSLQKMLINRFPDKLSNRNPRNVTLLYPALLFLRDVFKRDDISVHIGVLSQRAKDLNPSIEEEVGKHVLILGLFPLEMEAYLDRMTQKQVDRLARLMGTKPTWWRIAQLMDDV
ncbi:hypothetical protein GSI_01238 [Ganoderma sinense ZZ0214-1]|uniref:Uncharacterized protein n=1 Tax=Ganoderma sinense ZZ0214-1 TaxID=1077348 RepID=A0A2G8SUW2_9APHY|nr:hypothetical protein GSI_01238 [Ganoderma sinense ZZ0214-1]